MKKQHCTFSVIIPAYNYAHTVERAITSVLNQSIDDWELLVIDDGSTDNTAEVLAALASAHKDQFQWFRQQNAGLSAVRNKGIDNTTGDYLVFLDADDELEKDALKVLGCAVEENPQAALLIGGYTSVSEHRPDKYHRPLPLLHSRKPKRVEMYLISKKLSISNGATAMKRSIFSRYRYREDFFICEDIPMFAFALANFDVAAVYASLARIHHHHNSMRHSTGHIRNIGMLLVEEVFAPERMPQDMQTLKQKYTAKRALSLFKMLYDQKEYKEARKFYRLAFRHDWKQCILPKYTRRLIRSYF